MAQYRWQLVRAHEKMLFNGRQWPIAEQVSFARRFLFADCDDGGDAIRRSVRGNWLKFIYADACLNPYSDLECEENMNVKTWTRVETNGSLVEYFARKLSSCSFARANKTHLRTFVYAFYRSLYNRFYSTREGDAINPRLAAVIYITRVITRRLLRLRVSPRRERAKSCAKSSYDARRFFFFLFFFFLLYERRDRCIRRLVELLFTSRHREMWIRKKCATAAEWRRL